MASFTTFDDAGARSLLAALHRAALEAVRPGPAVLANLPAPPHGRCVVVGAGKASAAMAAALETAWPDVRLTGVVAAPHGHGVDAGRVTIVEGGHPVPDAGSLRAGHSMLQALSGLGPEDLVTAMISGGGSACLEAPAEGLDLSDLQAVNRALLDSGADIEEINTVRRHLSRIKGGGLARAGAPARMVTLIISDIPGDAPASVASGPTLADGTRGADALAIVSARRLRLPTHVLDVLRRPAAPAPPQGEVRVIASARTALQAAAAAVRARGLTPLILGDGIQGEAREVGKVLAGVALSARRWGAPLSPPAVILSGGETAVTLSGARGRGGRNCELALSMAMALGGAPGVWALCADTDGIDGDAAAAGAVIGPDTLARARVRGLDAGDHLARHDSYAFFSGTGDLLVTGPTLTNVNDFRAVLVA